MMKRLLIGLTTAFLILVAVLLVNTLTYKVPAEKVIAVKERAIDVKRVANHLSEAIRFRTVSSELPVNPQHQEFENFIGWLAQTYPQVHQVLNPQYLGTNGGEAYTILFTWPGTREDLKPVLLSAHYDVVPVIPGTDHLWHYPPYSGEVDQTHIWGRGALDDKSAAIAMMESATLLLAENFKPERTVYLALTHDEETGGKQGTAAIIEYLKQANVQLEWSLDEGAFLTQGFMPGVTKPVASINVAEKGYMTVELIAKGEGGHSSMPPKETAVDVLASALVKLQATPVPGGVEGMGGNLFDAVAPHMPFRQRLLFANQWLFSGVVDSILSGGTATRAMMRTTVAPTMLSASIKENVLPIHAVATVNLRVHPRDTIESLEQHIKAAINDPRVDIVVKRANPASRVSSMQAPGFKLIAQAVQQTYDSPIVAAGITIAGTDSRQYERVADNAYRFNPVLITREDLAGFHGNNERISIDNMVKATNFYYSLLESTLVERS